MSSPSGRRFFREYQSVMRHRVMDVVLASSPYDAFILEEAGELSERMVGEFRNLDLHYSPGLTSVSSGEAALRLAHEQSRLNLIVTTPHLPDMDAAELAIRARRSGLDVPVVLLAWDPQELSRFMAEADTGAIERAFLWQGDARILVAIVKSVEDWRNAEEDTREVGVQVILLVEDNVRYYSSFLPTIYTELLHHSQRVIAEGLNLSQKILKMRARPKILLCTSWEEAEAAFVAYGHSLLGIISDVEFPRGGRKHALAGSELAERVRTAYPDVPIMLHSSRPENEALARRVGADFLLKGSPLLLQDLREFMLRALGFGDFVFRTPDGSEVARAADLRGLEEKLGTVPEASIAYHAARNHFSRWLKARTEFALAHELRPRRLEDFGSVSAMRQDLIGSIAAYRRERSETVVTDFDRSSFDLSSGFYRIGGGSLGGKARGLAFVRRLLVEQGVRQRFPGVEIAVPASAVLGTDVFDAFLDENGLRSFSVECEDEQELSRRFLAGRFPAEATRDVAAFLEQARWPLAVRSSSLLEDSQHQPFTGVYDTRMLANDGTSLDQRLAQALVAIKHVYASTFSRHTRAYLRATPYRLEEEKMAVILQRVVGKAHGPRFYPDLSGVARSHNSYPTPPMSSRDGVVALALGLGREIADGGPCLRFCPRYPRHVLQFSCVADVLDTTQREFWALPLGACADVGMREQAFDLTAAESDGTLAAVASTHSQQDDAIHDGLARAGSRLVTFAPILKHGLFPLAELISELMALGEQGMGTPVEIEFAVDLGGGESRGVFGFLQMRPLALTRETEALELGEVEPSSVLCRSRRVLGNGRIEGVRDLVVVDFQRFERARSREAAAEIARVNARLVAERTPYLLVGVGRWGSRDPWLGIPVTWDQVSGARAIVEAGLRDLSVTPSQGTHFFQNLASFDVGYFTVNPELGDGFVDWDWLDAQPSLSRADHVRHLRLDAPVLVLMNGRRNEGLILKPGGAS
jgi:CheY-like chemotaxis protein